MSGGGTCLEGRGTFVWTPIFWIFPVTLLENGDIVPLQILFVLMSVEVYSGLQTCVIEGIEVLSNKFQNIFLSIKKKQYDVLDHRKPEFDRDYDDYQKYLFDLEVIRHHCYASFNAFETFTFDFILVNKCR